MIVEEADKEESVDGDYGKSTTPTFSSSSSEEYFLMTKDNLLLLNSLRRTSTRSLPMPWSWTSPWTTLPTWPRTLGGERQHAG
jgi:hypothetical protein